MYAPVCWKTHPDRIEVQHGCKVRQTTCSNSLDDKEQYFRTCYDDMELQKRKKANKETNFMMQRPFHLIKFLSSNLQAPYSLCQLCFNIYKYMRELTELHELSAIHQKYVLPFIVQHDVTKQKS